MIWNFVRRRPMPSDPCLPDGIRIYAVGDVHGRADLLERLFAAIDTDLEAYPAQRAIHVFLGDYVDRGMGSRQVLDLLIGRRRRHECVFLKGNHESYLLEFLAHPDVLAEWRTCGGLETLMSFGVRPRMSSGNEEWGDASRAFGSALSPAHHDFLARLELSFTCGDFFFVHAGVRPGVALSEQSEQDMLWIRDDFLGCDEEFEKMIVHGHTPVREPDFRLNRINIDTGAYATGVLSCLVLEGDEIEVISSATNVADSGVGDR